MPAYLTEGSRQYNQVHRIRPQDSVSQLGYYYSSFPPSSSSSSSTTNQPRRSKARQDVASVSSGSLGRVMPAIDSTNRIVAECNRIRRRQTGKFENDSSDWKSSHNSKSDSSLKRKKVGIIDGTISSEIHSESPVLSSGFSEDTPAEMTISKVFHFLEKPANSTKLNEPSRRALGSKYIDENQINTNGLEKSKKMRNLTNRARQRELANMSIGAQEFGVAMSQASRIKRRNIGRSNRRLLSRNDDNYLFNPYALSELFSQSEIPGFREIFASDSYLRKFCWVVAFLFMTVLSLNDMTELITEYYEYPITVGVRLRDSARLTFPSVTVCNLNVVRFSALCSSALYSRHNLTNQIPSELRDRLCGIQVEKKNNTDSDISDINNIGITTTTTTTPLPTTTNNSTVNATTTLSSENTEIDTKNLVENMTATTLMVSSTGSYADSTKMKTNSKSTDPLGYSVTNNPLRPDGGLDLGDFSGSSAFYMRYNDKPRPQPKTKPRRNKRTIQTTKQGRPFASVTGRVRIRAPEKDAEYAGESQFAGPQKSASQVIRNGPKDGQAAITLGSSQPGFNQHSSTTIPSVSSTVFSPPTLPEDFEVTERMERELQENLTNWLAVMYNRDSKLTRSLGHQFDDMILRCTMRFFNCTHQRSFDNSFTPTEGNCFTYRSKYRRFSGAIPGNNKFGSVYDEANLAGINHGLELVLNLEKSEYISGSSQVGALVMIHHPGDLGYAASEATFIAPEFTTYIGLKMVNITRLPAPYPENCVDSWPARFADKMTRNSTYSQQACLKICLQKTIQTHCQCQSATLPIVEIDQPITGANSTENQRIIICDTRRSTTRQCVREVMSRAVERVHNCDCPPKCQVVRYDKTVSMARWPTREDKVTFDRGKMDVNFQNLAKVIVYFQTMTCDEVTQHPVFNAAKLFSALGGIMGMYVGFSFLSVFEIFEVISRKTWHHFRVKISNKHSNRRWSSTIQ